MSADARDLSDGGGPAPAPGIAPGQAAAPGSGPAKGVDGNQIQTPSSTEKSSLSEFQLEAYKALVSVYNAEDGAFYTRNNIMMAIQAAMLATIATVLAKVVDVKDTESAKVLLSHLRAVECAIYVAGVVSAVTWLFAVRRSVFIANQIADELAALEEAFIPGEHKARVFWNLYRVLNGMAEMSLNSKLWKDEGRLARLDKRLRRQSLGRIWTIVTLAFAGIWSGLVVAIVVMSLLPDAPKAAASVPPPGGAAAAKLPGPGKAQEVAAQSLGSQGAAGGNADDGLNRSPASNQADPAQHRAPNRRSPHRRAKPFAER
jgi:hypothetical protein